MLHAAEWLGNAKIVLRSEWAGSSFVHVDVGDEVEFFNGGLGW